MNKDTEIYFKDARLDMTIVGRLCVRLVSYASYAFLVVVTGLALSGDVVWLRSLGILIALFLADRAVHSRGAAKNLVRLPSGRANAADYMTPASFGVIEWAFDRSVMTGKEIAPFIAVRLLQRRDVRRGLLRMDIAPEDVAGQLEIFMHSSQPKKYSKKDILSQAELILKNSLISAHQVGDTRIDPVDIFSALGSVGDELVNRLFNQFEINAEDLRSALIFSAGTSLSVIGRLPAGLVGILGRPHKLRHRIMNRSWTARPTPYLDQFSDDLTDQARLEKVGFLIGHANEYDRLEDVLARPGRPNVLLIGDPGSGKDALVGHLAFEISKDRVRPGLFDKRLVRLRVGSLVAGASQSEAQERVRKIIDEIVRAGNIILYIPEIHNLLKTSDGQGVSAADMLLPALKSGSFSVIGATYPAEYKRYIEANSDFSRGFETVTVQEISEAEAVQFLVFDSLLLERQNKIVISFPAIKQAVLIAKKYFHDKLLPGGAEDLLKEAIADVVQKNKKILKADDVVAVAEKRVNVPIHKVGKEESDSLLRLEDTIGKMLVGQEEAVAAVSRALREYRSGLTRKGGPIASFLFVGPTGVGKTELSKILAKIQFGSAGAMIRFDMSEYQDKGTANRLVDSIADAIRRKPYSLILLDEFEKADSDILNVFLQVFDDGRLTDASGRTADFQNSIIIATSNANSEYIKKEIEKGATVKNLSAQIKKKLSGYFKPELLNRFSAIVAFKPLSQQSILEITKIQLSELAATLKEGSGIEIRFDDPVIAEVARLGFDPVFGARPLRAVISEKIKAVLAKKILNGEIARGASVKAGLEKGIITYK